MRVPRPMVHQGPDSSSEEALSETDDDEELELDELFLEGAEGFNVCPSGGKIPTVESAPIKLLQAASVRIRLFILDHTPRTRVTASTFAESADASL